MKPDAYSDFLTDLQARLESDPRVVGLVLAGSTANRSHPPDEWSDHDFFVVTESGVQEQFRTALDWLPDHQAIVVSVRETEHGLKVLYASGHLIEFAVFDREEITLAKLNDYAVVFDRGGVADAARRIATTGPRLTTDPVELRHEGGMFLCLLVVGAGRVARGEALSGQVIIRAHAVGHLLRALSAVLPAARPEQLDNLDVFRRFELVFPQVGETLNAALQREPVDAALGLLDVYEEHLGASEAFLASGVTTVHAFLQRVQMQVSTR